MDNRHVARIIFSRPRSGRPESENREKTNFFESRDGKTVLVHAGFGEVETCFVVFLVAGEFLPEVVGGDGVFEARSRNKRHPNL